MLFGRCSGNGRELHIRGVGSLPRGILGRHPEVQQHIARVLSFVARLCFNVSSLPRLAGAGLGRGGPEKQSGVEVGGMMARLVVVLPRYAS